MACFNGRIVEVFWPEENRWFEGVLQESLPGGGHSVVYEDGDTGIVDSLYGNTQVKLLTEVAPQSNEVVVGSHVKCAFGDDGWFRGTVEVVPKDGVGWYEVKFDDGDFRDDVTLDEIKLFIFVPEEEEEEEEEEDEYAFEEKEPSPVAEVAFEHKYSAPAMAKDVSPLMTTDDGPPGIPPGLGSDGGGVSSPLSFNNQDNSPTHASHSEAFDSISGVQSPVHDFETDYNLVDPWFLPGVDSHSHGNISSLSTGMANPPHVTKTGLSLSFMPDTSPQSLATAPPDVKLAAMQIKCEALEAVRFERELRGSAWEEDGGMGHAPGGVDESGWKLLDSAVLATSLKPGGLKHFLESEEKALKASEGFGIMGEVDGIDEDKGKVVMSLIGPNGAAHGGALWEALLQARVRTLALVRLHHGPAPSLPLIQATAKLAKTYAHQSLWPQVGVHVGRAFELLRSMDDSGGSAIGADIDSFGMKRVATGVLGCFDAIRACTCEFSGTVPWDHLVGMVGEDDSGHPSASDTNNKNKTNPNFAVKLSTPFGVRQNIAPQGGSQYQRPPRSGLSRLDPTCEAVPETNQGSQTTGRRSGAGGVNQHRAMRWGDAVAFLRNHHVGLKKMTEQLEKGCREDHLALLLLAFAAAQPNNLNSIENSDGVKPPTTQMGRACGGSVVPHTLFADELVRRQALTTELGAWCVERMCDLINERKTAVFIGDSDYGGKSIPAHGAAIPLSWEEAVAILVVAIGESNKHFQEKAEELRGGTKTDREEFEMVEPTGFREIWKGRLQIELLLMEAQMLQHTGKLAQAEERLNSLHIILAENGWSDSMVACAAHTSSAELCVQKHMTKREVKVDNAKDEAEDWLASDHGHSLWRSEVKRLLSESRDSGKRLTRLELEYRARQALLKAKLEDIHKRHAEKEGKVNEPMQAAKGGFIDRAEESLLRVWEIHESSLGRNHPSTAASCLSLGNLCVITRDLPQAKLWFDSAKQILDICFDNQCMQITAATETQLGHVHAKLEGEDSEEKAAIHLERAANFYLNQSKACRDNVASSEGATMVALDIDENKRRFYTAKLANHLFSEAASHWLNVASLHSEAGDEKNGKIYAKKAVASQEKAVTGVGLMYGKNGGSDDGAASSEGSKILMNALKALANVYEATGDWRRAADAHSKHKTIASRVNGPQSKSVKASTLRHKKAIHKAATQRPEARTMSPGDGIGQGGASFSMSPSKQAFSPSVTSPMRDTQHMAETRRRATSPPQSTEEELTGEESWLR